MRGARRPCGYHRARARGSFYPHFRREICKGNLERDDTDFSAENTSRPAAREIQRAPRGEGARSIKYPEYSLARGSRCSKRRPNEKFRARCAERPRRGRARATWRRVDGTSYGHGDVQRFVAPPPPPELSFAARGSTEKSKPGARDADKRADGSVRPLLPVTATVLAFPLPTSNFILNDIPPTRNARIRACTRSRARIRSRRRATRGGYWGLLSYSFHHNNSPAYKYRRTNVCTASSTTSAERYRGSTWRSPSLRDPLSLPPSSTLRTRRALLR